MPVSLKRRGQVPPMAETAKDKDYDEALRREPSLSFPDGLSSHGATSSMDGVTDNQLMEELESLTRQIRTDYRPREDKTTSAVGRAIYLSLGGFCLSLGAIGVFIPGLPTTVFMIVALWAFTKSSPRMRDWLYHHRHFGPALQNWVQHRSIPARARQIAFASLLISALFIGYTFSGLACLAFILFVCAPVASFLWTLPDSPQR